MPVPRRSCDHCRAHKLKCEWLDAYGSCTQCKTRNKPCVMPSIPSTAGSLPSGIDLSMSRNYENRIKELEGIVNELKSLSPAPSRSYQATSSTSASSVDDDMGVQVSSSTAQKRAYDQINNQNAELFPPSFRIRTETPSLTTLPSYHPMKKPAYDSGRSKRDLPWSQFPARLNNCTRGTCFLPPPDEGYNLVSEYLHDFNSIIPLFHPETIYSHVRACYSGEADETQKLFWVLTYVALGIGHRLRAMSLFAAPEDASNGDFYLNKCLDILPDLLLQEPSLQLVQALLGVSVLLQTSYRSRRAALFVSTAMRMAQDLGYNESAQDQGSLIAKQAFYVFWIAFLLDTEMSLRANRPTTQRLADIGAPLPNAHSSDWWTLDTFDNHANTWKSNIFTLQASLGLIQAECSDELFSFSARRRPISLTTGIFENLASKLETWKRSNLLIHTNASDMLTTMYQSDIVHSVILEAKFFETQYLLHSTNALEGFAQRMDVFSPSNLKVASGMICRDLFADAQRLLEFAGLISQGNLSVTWASIHALIAAVCVVLACRMQESDGLNGGLDSTGFAINMQLYKSTVEALEIAAVKAKDTDLVSKIDVCRQMYTQVMALG